MKIDRDRQEEKLPRFWDKCRGFKIDLDIGQCLENIDPNGQKLIPLQLLPGATRSPPGCSTQ